MHERPVYMSGSLGSQQEDVNASGAAALINVLLIIITHYHYLKGDSTLRVSDISRKLSNHLKKL